MGNLRFINSLGLEKITSNDTTKKEILNSFLSSVFVREENTTVINLDNISNVISMENIIIDDVDVLNRLDKIDVNKSPGSAGIHPRILYEVRNEKASALKIIFNNLLQTQQVPLDWYIS